LATWFQFLFSQFPVKNERPDAMGNCSLFQRLEKAVQCQKRTDQPTNNDELWRGGAAPLFCGGTVFK